MSNNYLRQENNNILLITTVTCPLSPAAMHPKIFTFNMGRTPIKNVEFIPSMPAVVSNKIKLWEIQDSSVSRIYVQEIQWNVCYIHPSGRMYNNRNGGCDSRTGNSCGNYGGSIIDLINMYSYRYMMLCFDIERNGFRKSEVQANKIRDWIHSKRSRRGKQINFILCLSLEIWYYLNFII